MIQLMTSGHPRTTRYVRESCIFICLGKTIVSTFLKLPMKDASLKSVIDQQSYAQGWRKNIKKVTVSYNPRQNLAYKTKALCNF